LKSKFRIILYVLATFSCCSDSFSQDTTPPFFSCPLLDGSNLTLPEVDCTPDFTNGCSDDYIDDVEILDMDGTPLMLHENTSCGGDMNAYNFFEPVEGITTCVLNYGHSYEMVISNNIFNLFFYAYIDYNNDGTFDLVNELVTPILEISPATTIADYIITIPSTGIQPGLHRMRVVANFSPNVPFACILATWGETHDYLINLQPSWSESICGVLPDFTEAVYVSDNLDNFPVLQQFPVPGTAFTDSVEVTITATDYSGNSSSCSMMVHAFDGLAPEIICTDSIVIDDVLSDSLWVDLSIPVVIDNCSEVSVVNSYTGGQNASGYYYQGTTNVVYTASDDSGNMASCTTVVVVIPVNPACEYDLNTDGQVDAQDLIVLLEAFGCVGACAYDFDEDGVTGAADLSWFLGYFGLTCED
jgi:hypothetical protein